jgi:hypothetical protein
MVSNQLYVESYSNNEISSNNQMSYIKVYYCHV